MRWQGSTVYWQGLPLAHHTTTHQEMLHRANLLGGLAAPKESHQRLRRIACRGCVAAVAAMLTGALAAGGTGRRAAALPEPQLVTAPRQLAGVVKTRRCVATLGAALGSAVAAVAAQATVPDTRAAGRPVANGEFTFHRGTELKLLAAVRESVAGRREAAVGDPAQAERSLADVVLHSVDDFCWHTQWMMNVGDVKGELLDQALREQVRRCCDAPAERSERFAALELGTYVGYSAVRIARLLPPGGRLYSVDPDGDWQGIAAEIVELAGVRDRVKLVQQTAQAAIEELSQQGVTLDFVFIDHDKHEYLASLLQLERRGLLNKGCVVVADNVYVFDVVNYLAHVRSSGRYRSRYVQAAVEYAPRLAYIPVDINGRPLSQDIVDGMEISTFTAPA